MDEPLAADDYHQGEGGETNSLFSDTTSMTSSIAKYRLENGRTYHTYKEGSYILPNDQSENDRLDLQHHILLLTLDGKLHLSPAGKDKPLKRVLDGGTGTGIWALDFADEHPDSKVVGIDLSPIQPSFVPENVSFFVDDIEAPWTFNEPFDFIYLRMMTGSVRDWPKLFRQAFHNLTPGGYIELYDPVYPMGCDDGSLAPGSPLHRWSGLMAEAAKKLGSPMDSVYQYKTHLADTGFEDIVEAGYKWPTNTWPRDPKHKELGAWAHENIMQGLQALSLALFTRALGWNPAELDVFLQDVVKDLKDRRVHAYWHLRIVYARKPE